MMRNDCKIVLLMIVDKFGSEYGSGWLARLGRRNLEHDVYLAVQGATFWNRTI